MTVQPKTSNNTLLERLTDYLRDDLAEVDRFIRKTLQSSIGLTCEVEQYLQAGTGKRLRPMLALLSSKIAKTPHEYSVAVAAIVEILHVASLLHDDVIDQSHLRRGQPTVNARWGNDVAILAADYLYSHAFRVALAHLPPERVAAFCRVTATMCEGEMFQIEKRDCLLTEKDYHYIICCKTAKLFAVCMRMGSAKTGGNGKIAKAFEKYGLHFGCAFQITDDVLDLTADPKHLGKEIGTDIASGKQTLPLIHALEKASAADRDFLLKALNNGQPSSLIIECIEKYDGIQYAMSAARDHAKRACDSLDGFSSTPALDFLREMTELVINRTF